MGKLLVITGFVLGFLFSANFLHAKTSVHTVLDFKTFNVLTSKMDRLVQDLLTATEKDTIRIYFASDGGEITMQSHLLSALKNTKAKVICVNSGGAYSAAAEVFLSCPTKIVTEGHLMIHLIRTNNLFTGPKILPLDHPLQKLQLVSSAHRYDKYLTTSDMIAVLRGKDLWIPSRTLRQRIKSPINNKPGTFIRLLNAEILKKKVKQRKLTK